jgi:hypothetical protein
MMMYVGNAFSLSMLADLDEVMLKIKKIDVEEAKQLLTKEEFYSCIGHLATSNILSKIVGKDIPLNRQNIKLKKGDKILVFQILTRLEEGKILDEQELLKIPYVFMLVEVI